MEERRKNLEGVLFLRSASRENVQHIPDLPLTHPATCLCDPAAFKNGDVRFLICTDVAARGIDIKELPYIVNVTLPDRCFGVVISGYSWHRTPMARVASHLRS